MGTNINEMSDRARAMIAPEHRKELGILTAQEAEIKNETQAERDLQNSIRQYLNQREIDYINPPMNKKSTLPLGWPDFTLVFKGVPLTFECKVQGRKQSIEQNNRERSMLRNGWRYIVITSLADLKSVFTAIEVSKEV